MGVGAHEPAELLELLALRPPEEIPGSTEVGPARDDRERRIDPGGLRELDDEIERRVLEIGALRLVVVDPTDRRHACVRELQTDDGLVGSDEPLDGLDHVGQEQVVVEAERCGPEVAKDARGAHEGAVARDHDDLAARRGGGAQIGEGHRLAGRDQLEQHGGPRRGGIVDPHHVGPDGRSLRERGARGEPHAGMHGMSAGRHAHPIGGDLVKIVQRDVEGRAERGRAAPDVLAHRVLVRGAEGAVHEQGAALRQVGGERGEQRVVALGSHPAADRDPDARIRARIPVEELLDGDRCVGHSDETRDADESLGGHLRLQPVGGVSVFAHHHGDVGVVAGVGRGGREEQGQRERAGRRPRPAGSGARALVRVRVYRHQTTFILQRPQIRYGSWFQRLGRMTGARLRAASHLSDDRPSRILYEPSPWLPLTANPRVSL